VDYITREVNQLPGIGKVNFQVRTKEVTIEYDPDLVQVTDVQAAVERANKAMSERDGPAGPAADTIL
jgi:copper chaperone CopZ